MLITKPCIKCGLDKVVDKDFVKNYNNKSDNRDLWCNECRKKVEDEEDLIFYCKENNRGYSTILFKEAMRESKKKLNKMIKVEKITNYEEKLMKMVISYYFSKMNLMNNEGQKVKDNSNITKNNDIKVPLDLIKRWGNLEDPNEYEILEDNYQRYCMSFKVENEAQADYLRKAIAASLRVDKAIASGDAKEAETWMKVYDSAMKAGKLQPVQMSASDMLSGVVTFSQFFELVEKQGFIPPMPNIIRDDIDYAIWKFVNYNRELMDLPLVELGEVKNIMDYDYISGQEVLPLNKSSGD